MGGIFQRPNDEAEIGLVNSADDLPKLYGALVYQRGCDLQYPMPLRQSPARDTPESAVRPQVAASPTSPDNTTKACPMGRGTNTPNAPRPEVDTEKRSATHKVADASTPDQVCCSLTLTIHVIPNLSAHMPNTSPHICFSRGTDTVPPSDSLSQ